LKTEGSIKPVRFFNSLITQILLFLVLLAVLISIGTVTIQIRETREETRDKYASQAEIAVKLAASFVSAEDIDFYLKTLETDDNYNRLLDTLRSIQAMSGMTYVFLTQITDGGELFVFDTDPEEDSHMALGAFSDWVQSGLDSSLQFILSAGEKPAPYISNTEWGFFLTAREPIYRKDGSTAGYAGANFYMNTVLDAQANLFRINLIITVIIFIASLAVYFLIIHKLVAVPLKTLTLNVSKLSAGEILSQVLLSRKNEFSLLEDTFADMSKRNAYSKKITDVLTKTAIIFLSQREEGAFDDTMTQGLKPFCDALNLDIVSVWRNIHKPNGMYLSQVYRWNRESGGTTKPLKGLEDIAYSDFAPRWEYFLAEGNYVNGPARLLPEAAMLRSFGIVSVFVEPLFVNNTFWGFALFGDRRDERDFDDDSIGVMRSAAHLCINMVRRTEMVNAIIDAEKNTRELKIEADKDPLTGIHNRRYFDANMKRLINSLSRSNSLLSLLMIDIDFFKRYNDTYGHVEGDKCLKNIAQTLSQTITRADDFVARYGGEEFVVVLPNTDEPGAKLVADKLINNVRKCNIPHEKNDAADRVTISIGATTGKASHTYSTDDFVKKADEMLYKSKQDGRNRYSFKSF